MPYLPEAGFDDFKPDGKEGHTEKIIHMAYRVTPES